jgi:4-amino-4-deoxy-L-arabinose transferase-like glycosyltransferase
LFTLHKFFCLQTPLLSTRTYYFLFSLLGLIYLAGLFVPLMDNDSAHHADIGLRMYLTGDYVNMIDHRGDYIDKPHFLFWISALSYHIFGVTSFAFKFPSFLFTILGTYSVFRLAKELYDTETGKLAALIFASSFCIILANNDVRMDAILTACIAFATWHLVAYVHHKKFISLVGAALGLAIGFATKGHVGLVTPVAGIFFYILYKKQWRLLYHWHWLIVIILFGLFISPVVYCYYLQFNLHPEKISQGMKGVNGVKYILWSHSFDRISGHERFGGALGKEDHFFFLHTFLWTFAPWCFVAYIAFFVRLKNLFSQYAEWLSTGVFVMLAALINFSNFKLPHYMPILAPATALIVAHFFVLHWQENKWRKAFYIIQLVTSILLLAAALLVSFWAFAIKNNWILVGLIVLLAVFFFYLLNRFLSKMQKAIIISVMAVGIFFFLANTNFYPQLLTYQGGKPLADKTKAIDPKRVYFWKNTFSSSYNFYSSSVRQVYHDSLLEKEYGIWLIYSKSQQTEIDSAGLLLGKIFAVPDYEITRLKQSFVDPATRNKALDEMIMAEVIEKR